MRKTFLIALAALVAALGLAPIGTPAAAARPDPAPPAVVAQSPAPAPAPWSLRVVWVGDRLAVYTYDPTVGAWVFSFWL